MTESARTRFERVARLFREAVAAEPSARRRLLDERTADDPELRREVEALIEQESRLPPDLRDDGLDARASERAARLLSEWSGAPAVGTIAGYEIIDRIGTGGMGVVHRARQRQPNRIVALKLMHGLSASPDRLERFRAEAEILGRLRHPGIAQVHESGVHQGEAGPVPFIAMELVEGEPITEFARRHALSIDERVALMVRVCDAVEHAHRHGVVHRDLKPANILVEQDGGVGRPRLVDFGIAIEDGPAASGSRAMTSTGQLVGTLRFMSPEQAEGRRAEIDGRSDLYALGVVLYELLAGRPPIAVDDLPLPRAIEAIAITPPVPLGAIDRRLRGELETIVGKALEKERDRRYPSVAEFRADLERTLRREPIRAHPPSAFYRARTFARRHRAAVTGALLLAAVLVTASITSAVLAWRASEARARAERHFDAAHELSRTLLFEFDRMIEDLPGALPARRMLVERGLHYLGRLAEDAAAQPALRSEVAAGYLRIGELQGSQQRPSLGDLRGAKASFERAIELLDEAGDRSPGALRTRMAAHSHLGEATMALGDAAASREAYERALELAVELAPPDPADDLEAARDLSQVHQRLAEALGELGDADGYRVHMARADAITEALMRRHPNSASVRRDRAVSRFKQALRTAESDPAATAETLRSYLEIVAGLIADDPSNAVYRRDEAVGYQRLGDALLAIGATDEALDAYRRELSIGQALAEADPSNFTARSDQATPLCKIGEIHLARGEFEPARSAFDRYLQVSAHCVEIDPDASATQRELGVAYYKLFEWHRARADAGARASGERAADAQAARDWLSRALEHFRALEQKGRLRSRDASVPQTLADELAEYERSLAAEGP